MDTNTEFNLIVRIDATAITEKDISTYINLSNKENIVKINGTKYDITPIQFKEIKNLIEKKLKTLIKISKKQTQKYLIEYGIEGYGSDMTVLINGLNFHVNFAVTDEKTRKLGNELMDSIHKIIINND